MLDFGGLGLPQRQAALAGDGPLLVVAGPGSGKTTVLLARLAYLLRLRRVPPEAVLVLTFSTRAAGEFRARLDAWLGPEAAPVEVSTFHAFGLRLLRRWGTALGYRPGPLAVLPREESFSVLAEVAAAAGQPTDPASLAALAAHLERARLTERPGAGGPLVRAYEQALVARNAVDFPAMLTGPLRLWGERLEVRARCRERYRYLLCDELQDVCAAQYALLRALAGPGGNLTAVGDVCQTIFDWRGADPHFLLDFPAAFPGAQVVPLGENFRASQTLVELGNALSARLPYGQRQSTPNPPGPPANCYAAADEADEAEFVAGAMARLRAAGEVERLGEVAVLFRTREQARPLSQALHRAGLPYRFQEESRVPWGPGWAMGAASWTAEVSGRGRPRVADAARAQDAVLLSTIHGAKGGEWTVVFVVGLEEGLFPHLSADPEAELRLAYVALTRPRRRLLLSWCRSRRGAGGRRPSRFLQALSGHLVL